MNTTLALNSVRHRVIRNALARIQPELKPDSDLPPLDPGEMQLYSYFTPGILAGSYKIVAEQAISTGGQHNTIKADTQSFLVDPPRFSIDPALIHSTFPLQGVAAQANILPHVVLNDAHLPWQIEVGKTSGDKMRIPWLAVVTFEQSELKLQPDDPLFPPSLQSGANPPQSFTMTTRLTVEQLTGSGFQCALPDLDLQIQEDSTLPSKPIDVIFPNMDLFLALFGSTTGGTPEIDLDRFKYLAHARQVNTTHMTDAGVLDGGQFSIVFSHRTGPPFEKTAPLQHKQCVSHLVSLDWVQQIPSSVLTSNKRAALISLFSWTYDCIPPETVNFEEVMRTVGQNSKVYRTPDEIRDNVGNSLSATLRNRIKNRLEDGYTLLRYRVQTGEETVALMRGPLTPSQVPDASWMDIHSNTGEDLQIIDTQLGLMDISYCVAWQLGKSLAIADQAFCAALLRIRSNVYNAASNEAKQKTLSEQFEAATSKRVIDALSGHFDLMTQLSKESPNERRWDRPSLVQDRYKLLAEQKNSVVHNEFADNHLRSRVELFASATDGTHFTEVKDAKSADWDLVLNWILNKIYLENIPPWYLIPDPTWLPAESIRFFYVDHKWLSALIDGVLSVANHLDAQDKVRQCIKHQLQKYLNEEFHPLLKHPPQVPSYGFYLRSVVVDAFPDLVVRAPLPALATGEPDPRAEILRQENVRKDIMFCLLDRTPKDLQELIISQPPHQQCFMFGHDSTFTTDGFDLELRKVYSVRTNKHMQELRKESFAKGSDGPGRCSIYDWNTRVIRVDNFTKHISSVLRDARQQDQDIYDGEANASLVGIELNDPIYRLTFKPAQAFSAASQPPESSERHLLAFSLPGESAPADIPLPVRDYAPPFKGTPRPPKVLSGPPRRSASEFPSLSTFRTNTKSTLSLRQGFFLQSLTASDADSISILSEINFDDIEKCSSRFSPICFSLGDPPSTAKDNETKYLTSSPYGSNIIVKLTRNQVDPNSTDYINIFEIRIPLGTTSDSLITKPLDKDAVHMLNTMRFITSAKAYKNEAIIHLKPKAVSELSPLSHNPDMSFMIKRAYINPDALDSTISIVEMYKSTEGNSELAFDYIHHVQAKRQ